MMPKITATASSVPAFDQPLAAGSVIPGTTQVATPRAAAETSTRSKNLIVQILLDLMALGRTFACCFGSAGELLFCFSAFLLSAFLLILRSPRLPSTYRMSRSGQ